jgi:hypothetical protein
MTSAERAHLGFCHARIADRKASLALPFFFSTPWFLTCRSRMGNVGVLTPNLPLCGCFVMDRFVFLGLVGAGLAGLLLTQPSRADFPVKADIKFQFNLQSGPPRNGNNGSCMNGKEPWYLYFPVDPYMGQGPPLPPNRFPNWPGCFPPPDAAQCGPGGAPSPCPNPATSLRMYPNWPTQPYDSGNARPQLASYGRTDNAYGQNGNVILTSGTNSHGYGYPAPTVYPVSWQPVYYYGR